MIPPPEITSTQTYEDGWDQWPTGPRSLAEFARKHGWMARIGFSRGSVPGRAEGTWQTADIIGVWMDGFGRRGVAYWSRRPDSETASAQQWSVDATAIWETLGMPFPYANLTEIKHWISAHGDVDAGFWTTARGRVLAAREKARASTSGRTVREHA